ncbi:MAG: hypothetical protein Tsb0020_11050 [Haliangiales bacterium]
MIVQESISVATDDPEFIHIAHVQIENNGVDMGGPMWFERASLGWICDQLDACLEAYGFPGAETQSGDDALKVYESGPEQAPFVNLRNRRPKDATHGGVYVLMLSDPTARDLHSQLAALRGQTP